MRPFHRPSSERTGGNVAFAWVFAGMPLQRRGIADEFPPIRARERFRPNDSCCYLGFAAPWLSRTVSIIELCPEGVTIIVTRARERLGQPVGTAPRFSSGHAGLVPGPCRTVKMTV